jgi:hypothetical protein
MCSAADDMTAPDNADVELDELHAEIAAWLNRPETRPLFGEKPCCSGRSCPKCRPS